MPVLHVLAGPDGADKSSYVRDVLIPVTGLAFVNAVELTVQRVADRVRGGGHEVPEAKIRERYDRLWANVADAIQIADVADVFDNSSARHPFRVCATYVHGLTTGEAAWPSWTPSAVVQG